MSANPYVSPDGESGKPKRRSLFRVLAWSAVGVLLLLLLLPALRFPFPRSSRPAARRAVCINHLKSIGLALYSYHEAHGSFPPAYTVDANGKPLHSWRTLILPFIDQKELYDSIDLSKPWDDPANAKARQTVVEIYRCPAADESGDLTTYVAIVSPQSCFPLSKSCELDDITDRLQETLLAIEVPVDKAVPWMAPQDASKELFLSFNDDSNLPHGERINAVFADGHVLPLSLQSFSADQRRAMITVAGDDEVGELDE